MNLKEIWRYRELLLIFAWRDLKVRYKQTFFGVLWAVFIPFMSMVVFSVFFGNFAKMPSDDIPYPIFVLIGVLIWNYFSFSLTNATNSLVNYQNMIQKIYFPRLILPFSPIITGLVDLSISSSILFVLMIYYRIFPSQIGILIIPILILITILTALGIGLIFSAIKVKYRDVGYVLPFVIQLGMFITPVVYPLSLLEGEWEFILWFNPLTSVIESARASLLGTGDINWILIIFSLFFSFILFIIGLYFFGKFEKDFADVI